MIGKKFIKVLTIKGQLIRKIELDITQISIFILLLNIKTIKVFLTQSNMIP